MSFSSHFRGFCFRITYSCCYKQIIYDNGLSSENTNAEMFYIYGSGLTFKTHKGSSQIDRDKPTLYGLTGSLPLM